MRKFITGLVVGLCLMLAACGDTGSGGANGSTISMGTGVFSGNASITVTAGTAVTFDDSNGGPHNLVTGTGGQFSAESGAPSELGSNGLKFNGGDKQTVTFSTPGTYHITCTIHPSMQATITVH
jgi:plastocyanin